MRARLLALLGSDSEDWRARVGGGDMEYTTNRNGRYIRRITGCRCTSTVCLQRTTSSDERRKTELPLGALLLRNIHGSYYPLLPYPHRCDICLILFMI